MGDLSIDIQDAGLLASSLGLSTSQLDALDGNTDDKLQMGIIQKAFPDRFIRHELEVEYYQSNKRDVLGRQIPDRTAKHLLYFIDNGDGYIGAADLLLYSKGPGSDICYTKFKRGTALINAGYDKVDTIEWDNISGGVSALDYTDPEVEPIARRIKKL